MTTHLIAIHGAGMNAGVWGALAPQLAAAGLGSLMAPNLPGHGPADGPKGGAGLPDIGSMARFIEDKLAGLPAGDDAVLLGHSMGALVAMSAAAHPSVKAVVVMGAAAHMPVNPQLQAQAESDPAAAQKMIAKWSCDAAHPQHDAVRDVTLGIMQKTPPGVLAGDLAACNAYQGPVPFGKPLLVICGESDKMTPASAGAALAEQLGGACVTLSCGHMIMLERTTEAAAAISQFVQGL